MSLSIHPLPPAQTDESVRNCAKRAAEGDAADVDAAVQNAATAQKAWAKVPAVAVLPRGCRVERLPRDPWDVPLQGWLDENGLAWLDW